MNVKIFFRRIHLYLALLAGVVISITCLTGAILVFEKDIEMGLHKERYYYESTGQRLPADVLVQQVQQHLPKATVSGLKMYGDNHRTVEVAVRQKGSTEKENKRLTVFVHPQSGKVLDVYDYRASFWYWVMDVHRWMLGGKTGKLVVGISTIIFLFVLITGIILWWPKNKAILKSRLTMKRGAGFKRLNHDFHVVLGFYASIFLFIFAFTGLAWSFEWFNKAIYTVTGSAMVKPAKMKNTDSSATYSLEKIYAVAKQAVPDAQYYSLQIPEKRSDAISISVLPADAAHETATTQLQIDAATAKVLHIHRFADRNTGQQVRAAFKPIHLSNIYGWPSKVVGFVVCLLGFFFPVSGYIMWYNRWWKKRRKQA